MSLLVETRHQKVGHAPSRILTRRRMGGPWIGFWLRCFEKSCRSPFCTPDDVVGVEKYRQKKKKVVGKYRRKNVGGDEGFLTTIWLTGMKHGHWTDSRN